MSRVQIVVLGSAIALLLSVLNLVRQRRLREEYSWLWLLASVTYLLLAVSSAFYGWVARLIGASNAALAFTFLGFYFLVFISIQYSVQLSRLVTRSKDLAQMITILDGELRQLQERVDKQAYPGAAGLNDDGTDHGGITLSGSAEPARDETATRTA